MSGLKLIVAEKRKKMRRCIFFCGDENKKTSAFAEDKIEMVTRTGFEPVNACVKGM